MDIVDVHFKDQFTKKYAEKFQIKINKLATDIMNNSARETYNPPLMIDLAEILVIHRVSQLIRNH